ncbi:hypothetical protein BH23PSE1_BH23PSE1_08210 [soil metagenome]
MGESKGSDKRVRTSDPLDPLAANGRIGSRLRALYAEIEREPIPMNLVDLLERLDEAEAKNQK